MNTDDAERVLKATMDKALLEAIKQNIELEMEINSLRWGMHRLKNDNRELRRRIENVKKAISDQQE